MKDEVKHIPVLLAEVIDNLHLNKRIGRGEKPKVIDATVGAGGHSTEIVQRGANLLGIDADESMLNLARENLKKACPAPENTQEPCFTLIQGNFRDIDKIATKNGFNKVSNILLDLGISSVHLDESKRGFSFKDETQVLDMRLDPETQGPAAKDLLKLLREDQLEEMFLLAMPGWEARKLAKHVAFARVLAPIETVGDFLKVCAVLPQGKRTHPATKAFMALRMAVNTELSNLAEVLPKALDLLETGGRLLIISFHSGEDRIVKKVFQNWEKENKGVVITGPIFPSESEVQVNPRSRSAVLRVFEKK